MVEQNKWKDTDSHDFDPLADFPGIKQESLEQDSIEKISPNYERIWQNLMQAGLGEPALRAGAILLSTVLVLFVVWAMRNYLEGLPIPKMSRDRTAAQAAEIITPTIQGSELTLPPLPLELNQNRSIYRKASLFTSIPTRPRVDVITYTVVAGDSVFRIAEAFSLKPETIMWANTSILRDNPHRLQVGQVINILPTNGTYHKWSAGEDVQKIAEFYGVAAMDILEWPGNPFNTLTTDIQNPGLPPGTMLIIPGGSREMIDYGPPRIPRDNPAIARTYGPGHCGVLMDGIVGDGVFLWPTANHWLSGYDYSPETNHSGIDIGGQRSDSIWAVDDGVVVYSGWSNMGYGNLVVIDHGNEWQSLYGHLDSIFVSCGESVYQGATIATMGTTGNSSGPHLHFELLYGTVKVNPWNFLP